jgi:hypothetical protein
MWAVPGRVQLSEAAKDAALLLLSQRCANHDGAAAGAAGQHVTHTAGVAQAVDNNYVGYSSHGFVTRRVQQQQW